MSVNEANISELKLLRQHISELKTENAEIPDLRRKISEFNAERVELKHRIVEALRSTEETSKQRNAEKAKLKVRIEELEFKNIEFRDRLTKVKQNQSLINNSSNNTSSNFNLIAESMIMQYKKLLIDTSLPEDKEMDAFLDEVDKKKVSNEIRQRNWKRQAERKKLCFSASGQVQKFLLTYPEEKIP